ncbi:hypothetical protein HanRHA438_Chr07g0308341 [Helianthus annuus]|nr:hypothetical protein HanRHA438_Chr07g0308341 [Helianthus annuus]
MHSFPHVPATSSFLASSSFSRTVIIQSDSGDLGPCFWLSGSPLISICSASDGCWVGDWMERLEVGIPASTVSLSLRVIRYQLKSSLLNTATMFWLLRSKKWNFCMV